MRRQRVRNGCRASDLHEQVAGVARKQFTAGEQDGSRAIRVWGDIEHVERITDGLSLRVGIRLDCFSERGARIAGSVGVRSDGESCEAMLRHSEIVHVAPHEQGSLGRWRKALDGLEVAVERSRECRIYVRAKLIRELLH